MFSFRFLASIAFCAATACALAGPLITLTSQQREQEIIETIKPAVVLFEVETDRGIQWGSGFFVSSDGYAITNRHVVEGHQKATCLIGNKERCTARIIKIDDQYDMALVKVEVNREVPTVNLGDSDAAAEGTQVAVTGYPLVNILVYMGMAVDSSTSRGSVCGLRYAGDANSYLGDKTLQIDAPVTNGNSGGPVYRMDNGDVVGILTAGVGSAGNLTFAVPINPVKVLLASSNVQVKPHRIAPKSAESVVEPGDLRILNTISSTKELPPLFGRQFRFSATFTTEDTLQAMIDWSAVSGRVASAVTPMVQGGDSLYFGATDGRFYRMATTEMERTDVYADVSEEKQIFIFPPAVSDSILCGVSGKLQFKQEERGVALPGLLSIFGNRRTDTNVRGTGKVIGMNRRNGNIDWQVTTSFVGTPIVYNGKVYYGGVGERGCLDVLQGRPVTFGAAKQNSDESKGFLYAENSGNRPRWNLLGSVGPAGVVCLVIPLQGKEEEGLMVLRSRDKPLLKCFDPETGANKWSCEIGDGNDRDQPLSSAVVVDQASQHAYVLAAQNLASINTSSGKLDWVVDREQLRKEAAKKKNDDPTATYYFAGAITYHDNLLFVPCTDKRMRALDSSTGKELWAFPCRRDAGVATVHQGMVMFGSVDRYLYCVDAKTGALNWRVFVDGRVLGKVTVVNGMIYAPTQDGRVVVIRIPLR